MNARALIGYPWNSPQILRFIVIFCSCIVATELSSFFYTPPAILPVAVGVALAALVLYGKEQWPAVFLGILAVNFFNGAPYPAAIMIAIGNTLEALTGAFALDVVRFDPLLHRMRDIFGLLVVALTASLIVPIFGTIGYAITRALSLPALSVPFGAWWIGHILSLLVIAPFGIRWLTRITFVRPRREIYEIVVVFLALIAINELIFISDVTTIGGIPLVYAILIPLFWISLRLGARMMTLALVVTSLMILGGTALGLAQATTGIGEQLFLNEIFVIVLAIIFMVLTAVSEERYTTWLELQQQIRRLEEALRKISEDDNAKSEFIAILAHELRNPLAPVVSGVELLKLEKPDGETHGIIAQMGKGLDSVKRILDDLLDISRITQRKFTLHKERVDMREIIRRCISETRDIMQARRHTVTLDLGEKPAYVFGDPTRLEQIVSNLLTNAAKYTEPGGTIGVLVRMEKTVRIVVSDNGIGMTSDALRQIFEPFHQVASGRGGLGIGLSIVQRLTEMHSGEIRVESPGLGGGSTFTVTFPKMAP